MTSFRWLYRLNSSATSESVAASNTISRSLHAVAPAIFGFAVFCAASAVTVSCSPAETRKELLVRPTTAEFCCEASPSGGSAVPVGDEPEGILVAEDGRAGRVGGDA